MVRCGTCTLVYVVSVTVSSCRSKSSPPSRPRPPRPTPHAAPQAAENSKRGRAKSPRATSPSRLATPDPRASCLQDRSKHAPEHAKRAPEQLPPMNLFHGLVPLQTRARPRQARPRTTPTHELVPWPCPAPNTRQTTENTRQTTPHSPLGALPSSPPALPSRAPRPSNREACLRPANQVASPRLADLDLQPSPGALGSRQTRAANESSYSWPRRLSAAP